MRTDPQTIGDLAWALGGVMAMSGYRRAIEALCDIRPIVAYHVHAGRPSWHQMRAGHASAGVYVLYSRREADEYMTNYRSHHPGEPCYVVEVTK